MQYEIMLHTVTYWWFYEKCNAILDLCTVTICIMSKSTVLLKRKDASTFVASVRLILDL